MLLVAEIQDKIKLAADDDLSHAGFDKLKQRRSKLPAITHVDYSARVQTVHKETNPEFHQLISAFKRRTDIGVLINTSLNVRGEPPVCTPKDAVQCFLRTDMDYLVMNNIVLDKSKMKAIHITQAKEKEFELD